MMTPWGEQLQREHVLEEYPRPQLRRKQFTILNGMWDYAITENDRPPQTWAGKILVPFSPEAPLSGVEERLKPGQYLWYRRSFTFPQEAGKQWLLHFGAVDQQAQVYWNGKVLGTHTGGYTAFTLTLPEEEGTLVVRVRDDTDESPLARGKQKQDRGGIWYTPQSGIWQTVWAEQVPASYISNLRIRPLFDQSQVEITVESETETSCAVLFQGETYVGRSNCPIVVPVPMFRAWFPENPWLYDFTARLGEDRVESYFAMRKVEVCPDEHGVPRIHLNGRPYFMHGVLDQGYWPDGLYTAPSDAALIYDIQTMKDMGFNTLRKHVKVESLRWYYHCDRLGMLVWQDMPNGGAKVYKPFTVSVPLVTGLHRRDNSYTAFSRGDARGRTQYAQELKELVLQLRNVPSLVLWTAFNEGWGQFDAQNALELIRQLDPDRLIDHASGWHDQGIGQLCSRHVYFVPYHFKKDKKNRAVILSEYGGCNLKLPDHSWNEKNFGYSPQKNAEELLQAYDRLITDQIIPALEKGLSAAIYTQLSDVEDEVNGLVTYDRRVCKLSPAAIRNVNLSISGENQRR